MGQRSQIFVRFEKNPGEKEIVARYYKWNCGDQMISIVYHTIEWLKKHLDLNNCGSGQYLLWNQKEFIRILGTKYDLGDVVIITDILNKYGDYWKDDNDGKALIDIQCDGAIKYALLIRNNTLCNLSTIQQDMINYWKSLGYKAVFEKYDFPKHDQRKKVEKNFYNGQHVWLVSDNTYLSELYLRSCDRPAYEILEGMIREKNQKNVKVEVASERIDNLLNFMLDGERDTEFGIKEADYGNRVLCTSREDAEKYIEKTKLILEIHSRGLREKDFSLSQLHELQNYLERTEK